MTMNTNTVEKRSPDGNDLPRSQEHDPQSHRSVAAYLLRNIENYLTSIPIILCCFCSGLIDSCVFNAWGVFATMQTGAAPLPVMPLNAKLQADIHSR